MLHPLGDLPPSVYWRRRLALLASVIALVALLVLTARVLTSGGSAPSAAGAATTTSPAPRPTTHAHTAPPSTAATRSGKPSPSSTGSLRTSGSPRSAGASGTATSSAPPAKCTASQLSLSAASDRSSYAVGDQPVLSIIVKNSSADACVQDLADPQVILRVYNGESRVWGSHDCKIEPGTNDQTLMPGRAVRVSIVWSGLTSQPNNCTNRQRAGAGTYTLYASLSGREGAAAQFIIR